MLWRIASVGEKSRNLLSRLGYRLLEIQKVAAVTEKSTQLLYPEELETRISQFREVQKPEFKPGTFPSIGYYRLRDVLVTANRRVTSVVASSRFLIPDNADRGPWNLSVGFPTVAGVLRNSEEFVLVRLSTAKSDQIPRGILGGTTSPHNWYSWLFDILPTVWLAKKLPEEFRDWPMLLPADGLRKADWLEALNVLKPARDVQAIESSRYRLVKDLLWLEAPNCPGPLPLVNNVEARFRIHLTAYRDFKNDFDRLCSEKISEMGSSAQQFPQRVFLARNQDGLRPYNQEDAIAVSQEFGFQPVFLEELNFLETFQLFEGASHMVGPHGAGWTNMIFCKRGAKGLMWTWPTAMVDNWYANVAKIASVDFSVFVGSPENSNPHNVNPELLRFQLERMS